jgi:uncharacterized protein (DUF427 family)
MAKARWNGAVIAEAAKEAIVTVEGNAYFPIESIYREFFKSSDTHTVCGWKGTASYYDIVVDGAVNADAAWYYPQPKDEAKHIAGYVAFWKGVQVEA